MNGPGVDYLTEEDVALALNETQEDYAVAKPAESIEYKRNTGGPIKLALPKVI